MKNKLLVILILFLSFIYLSCSSLNKKEAWNSIKEAEWIRKGEPIIFEGENWYPRDIIENLIEDEVIKICTYKETDVYIEKTEVRPLNRLYTKFENHKYRLFEKNDQNR